MDYNDLLTRAWNEVPRAQTLPVGWYVLEGRGGKVKPGDDTRSSQVLFFYNVVEPTDDVDEDELEALGADYDFSANQITAQLWFEEQRDVDKVRGWIESHGVDIDAMTVKESIEKGTKNSRVLGYIDHRSYEDKASGEMKIAMDLKQIKTME